MTAGLPRAAPAAGDAAIVDGVNVDAAAAAVRACPGVADLVGGRFGDATSYLPGRRLPGIVVDRHTVRVSIRSRWDVTAAELLAQISAVLAPLVLGRLIDVVVADIDDPPPLTSPHSVRGGEPATAAPTSRTQVPPTAGPTPAAPPTLSASTPPNPPASTLL
jgi:hypothetical protein